MARWREFAVGLAAGGILSVLLLVLVVLPGDGNPSSASVRPTATSQGQTATGTNSLVATPTITPPPTIAPTNTPAAPTATPTPTPPPEPPTYTIQPGDNLSAICASEAPDVPDCLDAIIELNGLDSPDDIQAGETILIPVAQ